MECILTTPADFMNPSYAVRNYLDVIKEQTQEICCRMAQQMKE